MAKKKRGKRKLKVMRACLVWLGIVVCSLCTCRVIMAYLNHENVLLSDSQSYPIPEEGIPIELLNVVEKNPELRKFVSEYPEKKDKEIDIDISDDIVEGEVPIFMQWDERWGYAKYGDTYMGLSGCGPTVMSMVLVYLQKDDRWNPYEVAQYAQENGYYQDGEGTSWSFMSEGARDLGVNVESVNLDEEKMRQILRVGNPIICSVVPGDFTTTGHFIVLTGIAQDGRFIVHDPNRMSNTNKTWDYSTLKKQIAAMWAYYV